MILYTLFFKAQRLWTRAEAELRLLGVAVRMRAVFSELRPPSVVIPAVAAQQEVSKQYAV